MHIMNAFFNELDKAGVRYTHFKSNVNLENSFQHGGDFDVVVDPARQNDVYRVLAAFGAKQMNTTHAKKYPGVDNWLLFDEESGNIHHLHLHYQIMSGKKYVKEYLIPWRDQIFETRKLDPEWNIYVTDESLELLLLSVRMIIKAHMSDYIKAATGLYRTHKSLQQERTALISKVTQDRVDSYVSKLFSKANHDEVMRIILHEKLSGIDFLRLSRIVRGELRYSRRMSGFRAGWLSMTRSIQHYAQVILKKLGYVTFSKKTPVTRGGIFAFVGVDGSGKSTMSKDITKWLSRQFDCTKVYMGLGDGKTTPWVRLLKAGRKMTGASKETAETAKNGKEAKKVTFKENPKVYLRKLLLISAIYSTVKGNNKKIAWMSRYRINGGVSVLDRYTQLEMPDKNDGPKIASYDKTVDAHRFVSRMAEKELRQMEIVKRVKPDIVFRLNITAEESMRRKPEQTNIAFYQTKIDDLKKINFQNAEIIDIDAAQPYDKELLQIKKIIWNRL